MPNPLSGYISSWQSAYVSISNHLWSSGSYLKNAATALELQQFAFAASGLNDAGERLHDAALYFNIGPSNVHDNMYDAMHWIDLNIGGGAGVTMDDILNEMMSASFEQLSKFMGITDAYKVAVWDAPFNEEFYGALARGFKTWGV